MEALFDLTNPQKQILEMYSYGGKDVASIFIGIKINYKYEYEILQKAVNELIRRNDAFHLRIVNDNGLIRQKIQRPQKIVLSMKQFHTNEEYEVWASELSKQGLDIYGDLFQVYGFRIEDTFGVYFKFHHLISDGWSVQVVAAQMDEIYKCLLNGVEPQINNGTYADYIISEEQYMAGSKYLRDKLYWEQICEKELPLAQISDKPISSIDAKRMEIILDQEKAKSIRNYSKKHECSLFAFFTTVFGCYLSMLNHQDEIVIGTTFVDRNSRKFKNTIGMFANVIPLLLHINKDNLEDNFKRTQKSIFEAYKHQKYNYNCMAREMNVRNLFLVEINYQIAAKIGSDYYDSVDWFFQHGQNESLIINILDETDETIRINYDYLTCQYTVEEILLLHNHIINIIDEGIAGKEILSYLCEEERHKILKEFNATEAVLPAGKTVIDLFEEQVEKTPGCTAIVCGETKLTYKELNNRINILAQKLREMNVGRGDLVALLTERSIEMVIGIYGIIKAGGAYVPIDPMYPDERIQYILKDCSPKVLLTYGTEINTEIPLLRLEDSISWQGESMNLIKVNKLEDLVYCIYTSGTTGKPKGVMIEHGNLLNYIYYAICNYFHESKVIPLFTNYCFDLTVTTLFGVLLSGAALAIYGNDHDENMKDIFQGNDVTFAKMTPIHLRLAAGGNENKDNQINTLVLGGEELDTVTSNTILKKYGEHIKIHNEYGPTEATVGCCDYVFNTQYDVGKTVCIGKPISNTKIYIMQGERLCGIGVPGELCIAGAGVARGYLNRPELTAEKFIHHPYGEGKMYRTGDLARWLPDGNLEYLGRIDEQVKIRGFRIEPGEIENVIRSMKGIRDCAVVARKEEAGEKALYAYLVSEQELELGEIRSCLLEQLPDYMVPSYMMQIEVIPMTINGKLDKKALPEIKARSRQEYVAPETKLEQKICQIFGEILEVEKVGLRDNFFELGGHSLRATRLVNRLEAEFHQRITLKEFFANPTAERIAGWMEQESKEEYEPIPEAEKKEYYPMSSAQKRIYLVCQMDEAGIAYNMPQGIRLKGDVNPEAVRQALQQVTDRHEILRTEFSMQDGEPVQRIRDQVKADFTYEEDGETRENRLLEEFVRPFDLAQAPLLRTKLVKRREGYVLLMDMHHIIGDGMSVGNYIREISALYNGVEIEKPVRQYKDYSQWMRMRDFTEQKKYWVQQFQDEIPVLDMPLDYNRPKSQSYKGAVIEDKLEERLYEAVRRLAEETGTTEYMIFLSAAMVLLGKYSRQEEIVIGSPISGRVHQDTETMLGVFVNTLAIKGKPEEEKSYEDFLQEIRETCLKAYENQEYPFEELVEEIQVTRDMSRNPLFDVMLVLQNNEEIQVNFDGVETEPVVPESSIAKFDLTFTLYQEKKHCHILLEYSTDLFRKESAERILSHYIKVLEQVLDNRTRRLAEVEVITEEERNRILNEFNRTDASFPKEKTVIDLFEDQVQKTPEHTAVVCGEKELTYRELNQRVNVLAHKLRQDGVKPGDFVAVMAERSIELIIGIYGILKAGGAYVPVDPGYPEERIQYMLEDCRPKALLTYHCQIETDLPVIDLEDCISWKGEEKNPKKVNKPEGTAYCIYTSGTTGKPKGVMVEHHGLVNLKQYFETTYKITQADRVLQFAKAIFDASVWEMNMALLNGAILVMTSDEIILNTELFHTWFENNKISVATLPPNYYLQIGQIQPRLLITAGSESNWSIIEKAKNTKYRNAYGPTETTICATDWEYKGDSSAVISIGKPISNTKIYIMQGERLCGIGVPGELCIAGAGVARGYLNRPELTAEKFIHHPFGEGKMYRTGDLARWLPDGNLEYLGRIDEQVKIRGFRIEPGEIENVIRSMKGIRDCAVVARKEEAGEKALYAYLVSEQKLELGEIRSCLLEQLPDYMVPSYMMQIEAIPMTINGKLDKKALPEIKARSRQEYVAPETKLEQKICQIFGEILEVEKVGLRDNFFELGGHSLRATRLVNRLEAEFHQRITLKEFFANPTAERIAGWMEQESKEEYEPIPEAEKKEYYPMSSAQKRIYLVCQMDEAGIAYNMPQGIRLKGDVNPEAVRQALQQVTDRHEILRTEFSMQDGEPVQRIRDQVKADFTYEEDGETRENRLLEEFVRPFDLAQAPLLRTKLVKRREGYFLLMDMHHIIGDGMSVGNYIRELSALYNGVEMEQPVKQYKDYSQWMRMRDFTEQKKYWVQQFQDEIPVLDMPLDYNRPKSQSYKGAVIEDKLEERLYEAVRRLAEETGTTEYMIFLSAAMVLLGKYSRQEEIIIGSPISGRVHQDTEAMLGVFVNTLAIKGKPEEEKSYEDFLQEIRETCLKAYENQEYPFEELVEEIQVTRDMSRNPLFDVMLVLQNNEEIQVDFGGVETEPVVPESSIAKFDLTFTLYQEKKHCHILLEYSTDLFRKESAERILSHYIKVLEQVLDNRTRRLAEVEVITEEEKKRILKEFNRTDASFPEEKTVIDLFEEQVEKTPEQTAVVCGEKELTYRELNQRVNVLAHKLRQDGVKPGDFVAVMAERSIELIIGIYGILKAGGAYVPVDPGYPEERIQYMLEDCRPKALLTYHCQIETDLPVIDLENCISWKGEEKNPKKVNKPEDTAYCIYTSGTTGKPKGVMNKHVSLVNRLHWMNSAYPLTEQDVILQKTTFTFDVSVWELIWWSLVGARVVMLEPGGEKNPEQICHTIAENHVTVMHFVPSMLNSFMAYIENKDEELERIRSLKQVFSSGEALNSNVVHKFYATIHSRNHTNLVNLYGPTEACIDVTFYDCSGKEEERIIPIGKPIDNTQIYILNEKKLCGIGIPGELCIAGTGVAKGYLNKPELTKEKFIKNPFGAGCLYRTGDLTRWLTDGNIEYLGRMDRQVKIRGLRIELGEIENAIRRISYIKDCAVIDTEDKSGDKVILGYLVSDVKVQVTEIRNILKETLPEYMIPSQMMQVDNIPVTSNGKLDRKALPDIVIKSDRRYIPAQNEKDALLYACCEKVLGVGQFGSNDDFVELGGDSIKALKIATMMQEAGVEITVKEVLLRLLQNI